MSLDTSKEYILENERVRLTPLSSDHENIMMGFAINEPTLWTYSLLSADGEENMRAYLAAAFANKEKGLSYPFLVYDKLKGEYAGSTRFYDYQSIHNTIQLGYTWYGQYFQGTGINKQCKYLMLEFAFKELNLDRVEFRADANNQRSIAAMKSIGCTVEGILRSNCAKPGGRRDSIILSLLRDEWLGGKKDALAAKIELEKSKHND